MPTSWAIRSRPGAAPRRHERADEPRQPPLPATLAGGKPTRTAGAPRRRGAEAARQHTAPPHAPAAMSPASSPSLRRSSRHDDDSAPASPVGTMNDVIVCKISARQQRSADSADAAAASCRRGGFPAGAGSPLPARAAPSQSRVARRARRSGSAPHSGGRSPRYESVGGRDDACGLVGAHRGECILAHPKQGAGRVDGSAACTAATVAHTLSNM